MCSLFYIVAAIAIVVVIYSAPRRWAWTIPAIAVVLAIMGGHHHHRS